MYAFIEGELIDKSDGRAVVRPDGLGIGFFINVPLRTYSMLPNIGSSIKLFTSFQVREDSQSLYGFETSAERDLFEALLKISGVGGRTALAILDLPRDRIISAIAAGDTDALRQVPGVGPKTAGRIVLELKDRFAGELLNEWVKEFAHPDASSTACPTTQEGKNFIEAVEALVQLGYQYTQAREKIRKARLALGENAPSDQLIRYALQH